MLRELKNRLYFLVAQYFKWCAAIQLARWRPKVIVVTGSNGKTTTLHLLEAQLKNSARYSHHANTTYGIPFDILGLNRSTFSIWEWAYLFFAAPVKALKKPFTERVYVVEADCDRPHEGAFLSALLKPHITIWLSSARTHSVHFDAVVRSGRFSSVDQAIAYEFGHFAERTSELVIFNADNTLIQSQLLRTSAEQYPIRISGQLQSYAVSLSGTSFTLGGTTYAFPFLLPEETTYSIVACLEITQRLGRPIDPRFSDLVLPPGRCSMFAGVHETTIVDSSYNANLASVSALLSVMEKLPGTKWAILGDLIEQGHVEKEEHEKLAQLLTHSCFERIILVGPRLAEFTFPLLKKAFPRDTQVMSFIETRDALDYISGTLQGKEVLFFKGARFLEGMIEQLLLNPADAAKLCRREPVWKKRRKQWRL